MQLSCLGQPLPQLAFTKQSPPSARVESDEIFDQRMIFKDFSMLHISDPGNSNLRIIPVQSPEHWGSQQKIASRPELDNKHPLHPWSDC